MDNIQDGGNILPDLVNLGMPLGLSILANNIDKSVNDKKDNREDKKSQKGGDILSNNLLLELGLSVVPFSLIALGDTDEKKISEKDSLKKTKSKK